MYCKSCGEPLNDVQTICLKCGCQVGTGDRFCANCGKELAPNAAACLNCGAASNFGKKKSSGIADSLRSTGSADDWCPAGKDKIVCILLAFFLGGLGVHNFYLGETKKGLVRLLTSWIGVGFILALIDFIKMLMGSYEVNPDAFI